MTAQENPKDSNRTLKNEADEVQVVKPMPLKTLLEWESAVRPFKKRSREYFTTLGAIVLLLAIILIFLKEWFLILVVIALSFMVYVMGTIPPQSTTHKITNRGVVTGDRNYLWVELERFWFTQKWEQKVLNIDTAGLFSGRLMLLVNPADEAKIKTLLSEYLLLEEPEKTWMDRAGDWLSRNIPLEK